MIPDAPRVLNGIAGSLAMKVMPELRTPIAMQDVGLAASLLTMVAQEFNRAANRLTVENAAIRDILQAARALALPGDLGGRVSAAVEEAAPADLLIPTLQAANDRLRALLVEVHAAVEHLQGDAATALNDRIWEELKESTRRRHLVSLLA